MSIARYESYDNIGSMYELCSYYDNGVIMNELCSYISCMTFIMIPNIKDHLRLHHKFFCGICQNITGSLFPPFCKYAVKVVGLIQRHWDRFASLPPLLLLLLLDDKRCEQPRSLEQRQSAAPIQHHEPGSQSTTTWFSVAQPYHSTYNISLQKKLCLVENAGSEEGEMCETRATLAFVEAQPPPLLQMIPL